MSCEDTNNDSVSGLAVLEVDLNIQRGDDEFFEIVVKDEELNPIDITN